MEMLRFRQAATAVVAALGLTLASSASGSAATHSAAAHNTGTYSTASRVPGIDPRFIYDQLAYMATHFQHREAGYAAGGAGHDAFARYWTARMLQLLGRYGATAQRYPFKIPGWLGRPATTPGVNIEITVPGVTHAAQVVVIGCHYDGEASSTQSANDDASGCAIELGVAQAMARFWRSHGLYPARTLRFVIFDAEEQGLLGSFDYLNNAANGTVANTVAMLNEEQSGIGYPLRFLGNLASPLMPTHVFASPAAPGGIYRALHLSAAQAARNRAFASTLKLAVAGAFAAFRQLGYQELTYHGSGGRPVWQPIFTPDQLGQVPVAADTLGSSDQVPFTVAGIPAGTFAGNFSYYDRGAPASSYPFDQPQDTIGLMNTFAVGGAGQSQALTMALALPGMLTTWMLSQPGVLGQVPPDGRPIAAIGSIGRILPHRPVTLRATGYLPGVAAAKLRYSWSFGDGAAATGQVVRHVYAATGPLTLRLTVSAPHRPPRTISETVVPGHPATFGNPYAMSANAPVPKTVLEGRPPANPSVPLPAARPGLTDKVGRAGADRTEMPAGSSPLGWLLAGIALVIAVAAFVVVSRRRSGSRRASR